MKKILTLATLLLGCCLAVVAQTGSYQNDQYPASTQPKVPGQPPNAQARPAAPSQIPPDTTAPGQAQGEAVFPDQGASSQIVTVQGCLSQSASSFMLADNMGNNYQLSGDMSRLAKLVGKEIQVSGTATSNAVAEPGAMSSDDAASASPGSFAQISVTKVRKISNVCQPAAPGNPAIGQ